MTIISQVEKKKIFLALSNKQADNILWKQF